MARPAPSPRLRVDGRRNLASLRVRTYPGACTMKVRFELGLGKQYGRDDVAWLVESFGLRVTDVWEREVCVLSRGRDGRCERHHADDVMSDLVPSASARYQGEFFLPLHIEIGDIVVDGF